ncbi:MAG: hypothetical protein AB7O68_16900 [Pirellulales bacterium]
MLLRFLIIFFRLLTGDPLMVGIASPKGEQAKTDTDRIKKSLKELRNSWQVEDREFNAYTIRAYRFDNLHAEIFTFSLAPTTTNESKTLNLLIVEEAHKTDDTKRADQLDPMLASTGGVKWMIGVGCTRMCDFKRGCDGEFPNSKAIVCDVDRVIADRRKKYEETGDLRHLEYEKTFQRLLRQYGRANPEIKRNFYLEDTIESGNFVSRERLLSCGRPMSKAIRMDVLGLGIDWARRSDDTWAFVANQQNDVADMLKIPHVPYEQQVELIDAWLTEKRTRAVLQADGTVAEEHFAYADRILAVRGDSTGSAGDAPMELLASKTRLPVDEDSHFVFTVQSKNTLYLGFEAAVFRDPGDELRFSYPADHPLAGEFEQQTIDLEREYLREGEYLSVHHPDKPGAKDDAPDAGALALIAASGAGVGEIIVL